MHTNASAISRQTSYVGGFDGKARSTGGTRENERCRYLSPRSIGSSVTSSFSVGAAPRVRRLNLLINI